MSDMECATLQKARARQRGNQNEKHIFQTVRWRMDKKAGSLLWSENGGVVAGSEEAEQEASLFHAQKGKLKVAGEMKDGKMVRPTEGRTQKCEVVERKDSSGITVEQKKRKATRE